MPPSEVLAGECGRGHPITGESRPWTGEPGRPRTGEPGRLRLLCDEMNPIVLVFDGAGRLLRWSPSIAERTPPGSSPASGVQGPLLALEERILVEHLCATARAGQSQRGWSGRRDGVESAWTAIPIKGQSGHVEMIVVTGIERERGARSISPAESPDSALVDSHLPMWAFDRATLRFVAVNDKALSLHGYTRGDFLSARLTDLLPWERVPAVVNLFTDILPTVERSFREGYVRKDGSVIVLNTILKPATIQGRPLCAAVLSDMDEGD